MSRLRIALLQLDIHFGNPKANQEKIQQFFDQLQNLKEPVDIVLLPELWNTSYDLGRLNEIADHRGADTIRLCSRLAQEQRLYFIAGSVAEKSEEGVYNTTYVFDRNGDLIHQYRKTHLFRLMSEEKFLLSGNHIEGFLLDGEQALCNICYDIRFPEGIRKAAVEGAKILFVCAQWPHPRLYHWRQLLIARAIENQMYVVACNRVGEDPNNTFCGHSMIIDPWGEVVAEGMQKEEIVIGEIDLDKVTEVRGKIPIFEDRRTDLYV